jgi:glycosyltransferase involved in cell wall biosynthesis
MGIVIFGDLFTFPEGNAATNRVYAYAKGFNENGINAVVICFQNEYIDVHNGNIEGIRYFHPFLQKKRNKFFIVRRWFKLLKYFRTIKIIKEIDKEDKIIAVICYSRLFLTQLFVFILAKICKTKIILESNEYPFQYYQKSSFTKALGEVELFLELKLFDGVICISHYLVDFYKSRGILQEKLFVVPSIVDTTRFMSQFNSQLSFDYILYCGSLTIIKDGVDILIKSFAVIAERYHNLSLVLIGRGGSDKEEIEIRKLVKLLNIEKRVFFLGQISRKDIPGYLKNAKILALARPKSIIAEAGFPSKLTEYLATGKPVVVTSVGEIPDYLRDDVTAFLSLPNSVDSFAGKMDYVLKNYSFSLEVSKQGKELTATVFNYKFQANRIIEFISSL